MSRKLAFGLTLLLVTSQPAAAQQPTPQAPTQQQPPQQQPPPKPEEERPPTFEEQVVVTASKVEQQLVNAPATVSVVSADMIQSTPATNYAELFRAVPGVNIAQTSARDFNLTMRGATSTLSTSQLALVDGRSIYLDFFGFVAWDLLPVNPNEIRQIEVIRGPASAVWGANALNGVVNFISKTPRELAGESLTIGFGMFDRDVDDSGEDPGTQFSINGTHAAAVNDRWSYKISAGWYQSDAFARPTGTIPNQFNTPYPAFNNTDTAQPKVDTRVDYDAPGGSYRLTLAGGYSGTSGIIHTGIGPFDMDNNVGVGYGTMRYSRGALKFNVFTNILNGDATALLAVDATGNPIPFHFNTNTFDVEIGNSNPIGTRHVLSYGGNFRYNNFDLSIAPLGDNRSEGGAYAQDEIFLHDKVRFNIGARVDKFDVIDDAVFSPRLAVIFKPLRDHAIRVSYNKAFRSPSLINNFLQVTIVNQLDFARLASISPIFAQLGAFNFPVAAIGNTDLTEESIQAFEIGYTGNVRNRATLSAAIYWTRNEDEIFFTQTGRYRATTPPPGWVARLTSVGIPPQTALGILEALPPPCPSLQQPCTSGGLPSEFSYRNLGVNRNKGLELGIDAAATQALNVFANYSFQAEPDPDFDIEEVNLPPTHRFNVGFNYSAGRYLGNASVSYVGDAFFQDVLDARFHGWTEDYTQVNGAFGVRWMDGKIISSIKVINLFNEDVQSHVFGDIIKRQTIGELRFQF
jgi:outer membrane receptor protein involved in Fe transport